MIIVTDNARQDELLKIVNKEGYATVEDLSELLSVSAQTIRRDIKSLSKKKYLIRHHGGAGRCSSVINLNYELRQISEVDEKERIAQAIAEYIPDNSTLFLSIGTTTEIIAKQLYINRTGLRVITNSIRVANILYNKKDFEVIIPSGSIKTHNGGIAGSNVIDFIKNFRVDFLITSLGAIDTDGTMLDFDFNEVATVQTVMKTAKNIIVAANYTKFSASAAVELGNLQDIHALFCDQKPPSKICALLNGHNIKLVIAKNPVKN